MAAIFNALSNIALRRLFKFAVKRAIGKYLEDELLLDQLTVQSREGVISLTNISLNCTMLNEEFLSGLPFKLISLSIDKLEAKLSYSSLLAEGFKFRVERICVILEPNSRAAVSTEINHNDAAGSQSTFHSNNSRSTDTPDIPSKDFDPSSLNNDVNDGMAFIANWVEVLIAGLQVSVEDVDIVLRYTSSETQKPISRRRPPSSTLLSAEAGLHIRISNAIFYNSHPGVNSEGDTSVSMTAKVQAGAQSVDGVGTKKVCYDCT